MYRWAIMGNPINPVRIAEATAISAALLVFGFRFFRTNELMYGRA